MKFNLFKSESDLAFPRCEHRSPSGRQCSQPVCSTDPRFCGTHKPTPEQLATTELTEAAGTLSSPGEVHRFLKAVLLNRVRGRITPKEAAVYSYLCQNLLRSLREIDHFHELQSEREQRNRPSTWNVPTGLRPDELWHLPRPDRSDPEPAAQLPKNSATNSSASENVGAASCPEHREGSARLPLPAESPAAIAPPVSTRSTVPVASRANPASSSSEPAPRSLGEGGSSTSFTSKTPPPPFDPRHFYPLDPTLRVGTQNPDRSIPPPDETECRRLAARRGLDFNRRSPAHTGAHR